MDDEEARIIIRDLDNDKQKLLKEIARLKRLEADLNSTEAAVGISGLYAKKDAENEALRIAAQELLDKIDAVGTKDGDESDRVFARYEFEDLRTALGSK